MGFRILLGWAVRDLAVLLLHLLATVARLIGPGGARSVVAESVLVRQQLLILNRSRKRSPNLRLADRIVAGVCVLLTRPRRLIRSASVLKPSTLLRLHRALRTRKYSGPVLVTSYAIRVLSREVANRDAAGCA
jgi:putative transposase